MNPLEIIIIANGDEKSCGAEPLKLKTQINYLRQGMRLAYGEQLVVEFIDLNQTPVHPLAQKLVDEGRLFPLLLLNGEVKFEGGIPLLALKALLDQAGLVPIGN
ncbi:MAG: hypothetical protein GX050_05775 [Firmicutes bacterium]|nr:hypothetical protein [Bacillota bacterium]